MSTVARVAAPSGAADRRLGGPLLAWYAVLGAGLLLGLYAFGYQWANGLTVTGLTNTVTWGLYIVMFMFLVGISAGGLIVVAGAELLGTHRFEPLNRLAVIVSGTAIAAAAVSIVPDLGRPQMAWQMLVSPQPTSPLVWDMGVITIYLTIAAVDLWILTRPRPMPKALRVMAIVSLPVAVLVHSVTAWIFGFLVARPFWNTAILAPLFISSALVSGTALVLVVAAVVRRVSSWSLPDHVFADLGRLLAWFVAVDFFLLLAELVTAYTSQTDYHLAPLEMLFGGRLAPLFWAQITLGVAVPFAVYVVPALRRRTPLLVAAATLSILGVFAKRVNILMPGMYEPQVSLAPGIPLGRPGQGFGIDELYVPSWVEYGVVVGILAFSAALITVGVRRWVLPADPEAAARP
ncbi:MAG TPA: NrfD/PsrC family molybdoenzyme membrane anchor subunit [Egicoccus sp.]|nr:NrfD/PsrC family molybdoenzyme membrane anchor subunit [Egicoccus sp.]HSK25211.1 NrfD/PsrC family molybdoenzyme membrane anchor subunit [Egicoccus sp.]